MKKKTPTTESQPAPQPAPVAQPAPQPMPQWQPIPRPKTIERQGDLTEPIVARYPRVIGGVCEFCGTLDKNVPAEFQYKLCPHYRGMDLRCSYCPAGKDSSEVVSHAKLNIYGKPGSPDELIVVCNSYDCTRKHQQRFRR
jgi:hypothetical protein